jgi:DNA-binding MarR family transcriptional regulator
LLNAHASLLGRIESDLAEAGLPPLTWYDVLWAIRRAPGRRLRMSELASGVTLSRGGLTKLADRLEDAGLVRRELVDGDGRGLYAVLTDEGETMLRRMWPVYSRALRESFVDVLSADEAETIGRALARVGTTVEVA